MRALALRPAVWQAFHHQLGFPRLCAKTFFPFVHGRWALCLAGSRSLLRPAAIYQWASSRRPHFVGLQPDTRRPRCTLPGTPRAAAPTPRSIPCFIPSLRKVSRNRRFDSLSGPITGFVIMFSEFSRCTERRASIQTVLVTTNDDRFHYLPEGGS
jgi:hypothetical protein